jgi:hypothetical protein
MNTECPKIRATIQQYTAKLKFKKNLRKMWKKSVVGNTQDLSQ